MSGFVFTGGWYDPPYSVGVLVFSLCMHVRDELDAAVLVWVLEACGHEDACVYYALRRGQAFFLRIHCASTSSFRVSPR